MGIRGRGVQKRVPRESCPKSVSSPVAWDMWFVLEKGWHVGVDLTVRVMLSIVGCGQKNSSAFE